MKQMGSLISASVIVFKMDRRNFIKSGCAVCTAVVGAGFIASTLSSCTSLPVYKGVTERDRLSIPFAAFTEGNLLVVRSNKMEHDILLVKKSESDVAALLMQCTHQNAALSANKTGLFCASHGSTFDLEGNVTKEPALKQLKKFSTEINNQTITINLKS
jgi:nitrite reductase/ring-hydroxylating ferredoxin subunit